MLYYLGGIFFVIASVLYGIHYSIRYGRKGKLIDKIPGPRAFPFIGNLWEILLPMDQLWNHLRETNDKYYPINRFWIAHLPMVNLRHPDDVEVLLSSMKHTEKSSIYNFLHPWLGEGLITSKDAKWRQRRKVLTPAFHFDVLKQFVGIFIEHSNKMVESLCLEGEEEVRKLVSMLHKFTWNSMCETAMGATSMTDHTFQKQYKSGVSTISKLFVYRLFRPWLYADWMFSYSKKYKTQIDTLQVIHGLSTQIINERKQYHEETDGQSLKGLGSYGDSTSYDFDKEASKGKRRLAMLDLLIAAQKQNSETIDDEGIREEVDTFITAGFESTAIALTFALLLLAENQEIQSKARNEVDAVFDETGEEKLSLKEIQSLTYLERCIRESLRLFPSVPFIARQIKEDVQLKDYLIPAGTMVNVHIWDLHRDPNFWPNPNVYDPDRFLPENSQGRHPFAFLPFSAGPRNCIGQKFAMIELKVLIAKVIRNFYLEPIDKKNTVQLLMGMVLRSTNPLRVKFIRRSY